MLGNKLNELVRLYGLLVLFFLIFKLRSICFTITALFAGTSITLDGFNLDFCLLPIFIAGQLNMTDSFIPLDEFPTQNPNL